MESKMWHSVKFHLEVQNTDKNKLISTPLFPQCIKNRREKRLFSQCNKISLINSNWKTCFAILTRVLITLPIFRNAEQHFQKLPRFFTGQTLSSLQKFVFRANEMCRTAVPSRRWSLSNNSVNATFCSSPVLCQVLSFLLSLNVSNATGSYTAFPLNVQTDFETTSRDTNAVR